MRGSRVRVTQAAPSNLMRHRCVRFDAKGRWAARAAAAVPHLGTAHCSPSELPRLPMVQKLSEQEQLMATYITLNVICASLDIFWIYAGRTNEKHLPEHVLNSFQRFIVFDREAHFRTAIVTLLTLFDTTRSTITLDRMIKGGAVD